MTFTAIVAKVADRLNLTSAAALTRIGEEVNDRYRELMSGIGLQTSIRTTVSQAVTVGNRNVEFDCEKVFSVFNNYGRSVSSITRSGTTATVTTSIDHGYAEGDSVEVAGATQTDYNGVFVITSTPTDTTFTYEVANSPVTPATGTITVQLLQTQWILGERTVDELRMMPIQADPPQNYAVLSMNADAVTVMLDAIPSSAYILNADVETNITSMSGSDVPAFPQDFHDILVRGGMADELYKMEKYELSQVQEDKFEKRLSELRLFIAKSSGLNIFQGRYQGYTFNLNGLVR
jgi:hypothetical protein